MTKQAAAGPIHSEKAIEAANTNRFVAVLMDYTVRSGALGCDTGMIGEVLGLNNAGTAISQLLDD